MRFQKLKTAIGASLVIFIIIVGLVISIGLYNGLLAASPAKGNIMLPSSKNNYAIQDTQAAAPAINSQESIPQATTADTSQAAPATSQPAVPQAVDSPQPAPVQDPPVIMHTRRTMAS